MLDIETLRFIWWFLLGFLIIGFAVLDGFDFGAAILLPLIARNEVEKQVVLNTIRPFWEGNQVWIILGAGAIFAAWPMVYAVAFSGTYFVVLLLLLTMGISRPVSFKYREKLNNFTWRRTWDVIVFIGGFFPAIIFGVLMGNLLLGLPFYFNDDLRIVYPGNITDLFHPFALWCGLVSVAMLTMQGGFYVAMKTDEPLRSRALFYGRIAALTLVVTFAMGGFWVSQHLLGYSVVGGVDHHGFSNPLGKQVIQVIGGWMLNYSYYPYTMIVPALGFLGAIGAILMGNLGTGRLAFLSSCVSIVGVVGAVGVSMFPFIVPSNIDFASSLLVWDASSTRLTLLMMLFAVIVFMPIILIYTAWVYRVLRGKVRQESIVLDHSGLKPGEE